MLLIWHQKLNHVGYSYVGWLAEQGYLGNKAKAIASTVKGDSLPKCTTCLYAKQEQTLKGTTITCIKKDKKSALQRNVLKPGQVVAMDHYVQPIPGRAANLYGSSGPHYVGGTVFVGIASGCIKMIH